MAFFLRKMFKFGPLRLNLSKSGVGLSAGVTGARVGIRGSDRRLYLHAGRYGLYYRETLGPDDPYTDDAVGRIAARIEALLDERMEAWLPPLRTLGADSATAREQQAAANEFAAVTNEVVETLKKDGLPLDTDGDLAGVADYILTDIMLARAFPEVYDRWNSALDDRLGLADQAAREALSPALVEEAAEQLRHGAEFGEVLAALHGQVAPSLERKELVIGDNPVYVMRLSKVVTDAIVDALYAVAG